MNTKVISQQANMSEVEIGDTHLSHEEDTSHVALRKSIPLRLRKIVKKSIGRVLMLSVPAGIVLVIYFAGLRSLEGGDPGGIGAAFLQKAVTFNIIVVGIAAAIVLWSPFWEFLYFITYFYDMDDNNVVIRKGVITKREITLPFAKITDVFVDQDLLDVVLGLYDVHISTPTIESGKFAHIDGVDRAGSKKLRQMILDRVNTAEN